MSNDRLPPHDRDAERCVLGAILRDNRLMDDVAQVLRDEDFYLYAHQCIFQATKRLIAAGKPADTLTLLEEIRAAGQETDVRASYLAELWDAWELPSNGRHWAEIVRRKGVARRVIQAAADLSKLANEPGADPDELIAECERQVFSLADVGIVGQTETQSAMTGKFLDEMDRRTGHLDGEQRDGAIETGWPDVDSLIGWLYPGELTIVAARPSVGKTMFAGNLVVRVAERGHPVFFASLEQTGVELLSRMVASKAPIHSQRLRKGMIGPEDRQKILAASQALQPLPIHYDDAGRQTMLRIAANARRLRRRVGLRMVMVDYLQFIDPGKSEPGRKRYEEVGTIAKELKRLARDLAIPVVALAQLGRDVDAGGPSRKPRLSDLRESGDIEQHADCVIALHRTATEQDNAQTQLLELLVLKCRNGPTGTAFLVHDRPHFSLNSRAFD